MDEFIGLIDAIAQGLKAKGIRLPSGVSSEAKQGLEWSKKHNRGGTHVGKNTAQTLATGKRISADLAQRMWSYFRRHEVDKKAQGFREGEPGYPSAGLIAWKLWGGDPAYRALKQLVDKKKLQDSYIPSGFMTLDEVRKHGKLVSNVPRSIRHCVAKVYDGGDQKDREGLSRAFAICTAAMQKSGQVKPGTQKETKKGKKAHEPSDQKDAEYERILGAVRQ